MSKIWGDKLPVRTDLIEKICNTYDLSLNQVITLKEKEKKRQWMIKNTGKNFVFNGRLGDV